MLHDYKYAQLILSLVQAFLDHRNLGLSLSQINGACGFVLLLLVTLI